MATTTVKPLDNSSEVMALVGRVAEIKRMDVNAATGLPSTLYISNSFYAAGQITLFEREWLCIGRTDDVPVSGDYFVSEIGVRYVASISKLRQLRAPDLNLHLHTHGVPSVVSGPRNHPLPNCDRARSLRLPRQRKGSPYLRFRRRAR